jgi:hypothetical protein
MATTEFGNGPDELRLYFTQDPLGTEPARINFGIIENGVFTANTATWQPVQAIRGAEPDVFVVKGNFPADSAFFFSFLNDETAGAEDRNIQLVRAEINGNPIAAATAAADMNGDFGAFSFDGNAARPGPGPVDPPPPVAGQNINGTGGADTLQGTEGNDRIQGLAGDDRIAGLGGDDVIRGGSGSDVLDGGAGNDTIFTSGGRDTILFGKNGFGRDVVTDFEPGVDQVRLVGDTTGLIYIGLGDDGTLVKFGDDNSSHLILANVSVNDVSQGIIIA